DLSRVKGSGALGRITREDVLSFLAEGSSGTTREELVVLTPMRRSIAEHMSRSVSTSPHAWTLQEVDVSELVAYRNASKATFEQRHSVPLTYLPLIAQVVCQALKEFPYLNSSWTPEGILLKRYVNLGLAVALPEGLIVPVIKNADQMELVDLARAIHDSVSRARSGKLRPQDVEGGTFTLNNTGATGSVASYPIINQPQAAILTTEAIVRRPVVVGEEMVIRHLMNVCLAFDHRMLDGMMAGQFLTFIRERLFYAPNNPS
ncbi:MAG: dihydrolipoamide acetyltransferase family protein, partial [Candidatus Dormibacteraceae bacterium]